MTMTSILVVEKKKLFEKRLSEILYESLARLENKAARRDVRLSIPIPSVDTAL